MRISVNDLVKKHSELNGLTQKEVVQTIKDFTTIVETFVREYGNDENLVIIPNLGSFSVKQRAEKQGINPQTKEVITIPSRKVLTFKSGNNIKELLK